MRVSSTARNSSSHLDSLSSGWPLENQLDHEAEAARFLTETVLIVASIVLAAAAAQRRGVVVRGGGEGGS